MNLYELKLGFFCDFLLKLATEMLFFEENPFRKMSKISNWCKLHACTSFKMINSEFWHFFNSSYHPNVRVDSSKCRNDVKNLTLLSNVRLSTSFWCLKESIHYDAFRRFSTFIQLALKPLLSFFKKFVLMIGIAKGIRSIVKTSSDIPRLKA